MTTCGGDEVDRTWSRVRTALVLVGVAALVLLLATDAATTLVVVVLVAIVVVAVIDEVLGRRRLHAAVGLDHLGFFEADDVLREARTGPLPPDPAGRAEAARLVRARRQFLDRSAKRNVVVLAGLTAAGVVLFVLGEGWALAFVGGLLGSVVGLWGDRRSSARRLGRLQHPQGPQARTAP